MKIKKIIKVKPRRVYAVGTSSGTFIADGLAHHNCKNCNRNQGEQYLYGKFMKKRYGQKVVDELERNRHKTKKITRKEYYKLIEDYKNKLLKLK